MSLRQIVALLGPGDSEPTIKYSALCQLTAMLQEPNLIHPFLQCDGVKICVKLLDEALVSSAFSLKFVSTDCVFL